MKRTKDAKAEMMRILDGAGLQITRPDGQVVACGVLTAESAGVVRIAWYEPEAQEFDPTDPRITLPESPSVILPARYQIIDRDGDELAAGDLADLTGGRGARTVRMSGFELRPE